MPMGNMAFELWYEWRLGRAKVDWMAQPLFLWITVMAIEFTYNAIKAWKDDKQMNKAQIDLCRWLVDGR